jgi:hypothetical protein
MSESDDHAELNRLVSGEMPDKEALALMRRMLRDSELRETYTRLEAVDRWARSAYLAERAPHQAGLIDAAAAAAAETDEQEDEPERVSGGAITASPETGAGTSDDRRRQIDAILQRIDGRRPFRRRQKIRRRAIGWAKGSRALPWTLAASLAVTCSLLFHLLPQGGSRQGMEQFVQRVDRQQAALYASTARQLRGDNLHGPVVWGQDGEGKVSPTVGANQNSSQCEVVLRATLVCFDRSDDSACRRWKTDVLTGRDTTVELATGDWPSSVKVCVAPTREGLIPVSIQAQLEDSPRLEINNQLLLVQPGTVTSVGAVTSGAYRYELFVEAVPDECHGQ